MQGRRHGSTRGAAPGGSCAGNLPAWQAQGRQGQARSAGRPMHVLPLSPRFGRARAARRSSPARTESRRRRRARRPPPLPPSCWPSSAVCGRTRAPRRARGRPRQRLGALMKRTRLRHHHRRLRRRRATRAVLAYAAGAANGVAAAGVRCTGRLVPPQARAAAAGSAGPTSVVSALRGRKGTGRTRTAVAAAGGVARRHAPNVVARTVALRTNERPASNPIGSYDFTQSNRAAQKEIRATVCALHDDPVLVRAFGEHTGV